ncbi:MAG: glycosyltransferase [Planctomycetota bacterium]|nr:glycosyltransferase [Planctomycetota bacterium]
MTAISVVLAAYRGEKYIGEQLRSLFAQTRLPDEILIGDDSPDAATRRAIAGVLPEKPASVKLEIIVNPAPLGVVKNFAALLARASGDGVFLCDQDDIWLPEKIARLTAAFEAHPKKMVFACDSWRVNEDLSARGERLLPRRAAPWIAAQINRGGALALVPRYLFAYGHNLLVRREFIARALPVPENYLGCDAWFRNLAALTEKFYYENAPLTYYRVHENNVTNLELTGFPVTRLTRYRQIRAMSGAEKIAEFSRRRDEFITLKIEAEKRLFAEEIPPVNRQLLAQFIDFYARRIEVTPLPRWRRPWKLLRAAPLYFSAGTGWRAWLRDWFSR